MEMAKVKSCEVDQCAFNSEHLCRAFAITIGNQDDPMCDTFCQSSTRGGSEENIAGVGACKIESCAHNQNLECNCPDISVGFKADQIDCLSFSTS